MADRMDLTIKEIAEACGGMLVLQGGRIKDDMRVSSVVIDSRAVEPGGVFLATVGERVDGHQFIPDVYAKGAALVVTQKGPEQVEAEHGCRASDWGCYVLVEDTLQALKEIAEAYRKKLPVKVVGITGSVGKTSTKEFIAAVLAEKYRVLKTEGNFNNEIGVPLTLLRIRREHELAVVEMGISDFGEMRRLSRMARPDVCVMTNIGQSHLNNLIDRDGILRAKSEIFDYMAPDGEICLNGEDDKLNAIQEIKGHRPHFFGLGSNPAQEAAAVDIVSRGLWGSDAALRLRRRTGALQAENPDAGEFPGESWDTGELSVGRVRGETGRWEEETVGIHVPQPGRHMVLNAAAAACVAMLLGLNAEQIAAGIGKVASVSGRTNIISTPHYTIIDDCYNANPASVKAAIDLLAMADTRKVAILGDMLNLGEDSDRYHAEIGTFAVQAGIDHILCVGEASRHMYRAALEAAESREQKGLPACSVSRYGDRKELLEILAGDRKGLMPPGSTILIKASHDMGFAEILEFLRTMG